MDRRNWTLLAVCFNEGQPMQPVQLQKTLFLLGERFRASVGPDFYSFRPYYYGPFSRDVYEDAEELASDGLIYIDRHQWAEYSATAAGLQRADTLAEQGPKDAIAFLKKAVDWARPLSFQQLVSAIYKEFPSQRLNSVFQE